MRKAISKAVQKWVEIVVLDDIHPLLGMRPIMLVEMADDLQPHGRLARPFFAEHHGGGRLGRIAVDLVPGRMKGAVDAVFLEDRIGLGVFLGERIDLDAVMCEEAVGFHGARNRCWRCLPVICRLCFSITNRARSCRPGRC